MEQAYGETYTNIQEKGWKKISLGIFLSGDIIEGTKEQSFAVGS